MTLATDDRPSKIASIAVQTSADRFITIKGDWAHFKLIQKGCEQNSGTRLFYFDGMIEIFMTGRSHELFSHIIGHLLTCFLAYQGIYFFPFGTADQEREGIAASQPDQSYCFGTVKPIPDLSIEVVFTSGGVEKLQRYRSIGVPEVWFWEDGTLTLYHLRGDNYERIEKSELEELKDLDVSILKRHIMMGETNVGEAIRSFTAYAMQKK